MDGFGDRLRTARETRGVALRDIASATKISIVALEALERNDCTKLPGGLFGRAFIRAYALEVGLDPEATVKDFVAELGRTEHDQKVAARVEITPDDRAFLERQRRATRWLKIGAVLLLVLIITVVAWQTRPLWNRSPAPTPTPGPAPSASPEAGRGQDLVLPAIPPATPSATPSPTADTLAIAFNVTASCWVRILADGKVVVDGVVPAGEHRQVSAVREVSLDVGNAGAFVWEVNGKPAKPLGSGSVRKTVRVTPATVPDFVR